MSPIKESHANDFAVDLGLRHGTSHGNEDIRQWLVRSQTQSKRVSGAPLSVDSARPKPSIRLDE